MSVVLRMKRIILSLFAILTAIFTYAGDGTKENPMTVADVLAASMDESTVWVKGYIVGNINGAKMENIQFTAEGASATNIALADAWNEKNVANCIPVQLPTGEIRNAINLKGNPGNLGKELLIQAQLGKYFGQNGLKNTAAFELNSSNDYEAPLTNGQDAWTFENTVLPNGLTTIWSQSSSYGMRASAYANSTYYKTESYLVSPTLVLGKGCVLTFEHVQRYSADDPSTQLSLWIRLEGVTRWNSQLTIPNYSDGTNWTFVSSGNIDLSAYAGKSIQLGFRYSSNENYAATWEIKNVKVTNAGKKYSDARIINALNYTRNYGDANPKFEYTVEGGELDGIPEIICEATKASPVGEYPIKIMRGTVRNTNCTFVNGTLTITPAPVIAFVNDAERLYGQENPDFYVTYAGLKNSEKQLTFTEPPIFHTEATKTSGVGKYSVTVSGKAKNYVIAEVDPGTLTINPAPLTIKVNDISRVYYSPNPSTYYFSYSGFVNNDNEQVLTQRPSIKTDATQTSDAGKYVILPENAKAKNYDISYEPGLLTINKRLLKATVNDARREYGEENPNFSISYSGFVNNENESVLTQKPTISVNASRSSNVGSYLVSVSGGSSKNYEINCENGVLVVEKAPLTAKVDDVSKIYGQNNPPFTITYEGLKNGEKSPKWEKALEFKTVATAESGVGQHYISASGTPVNYNLKSVESGILTITPAPLTIKAKGASRMYYEDDPDFSFTCSGFVNSDNESVLTKNPTYTTDATMTSNVGKYSITPSGAAAKNYEISYEQGELTITKRPLKVTSHSSREYGEENPQFPLEYDGFVNYEDASVITTKPTASTAATRRSNVGEYPITLRGGEAKNYEISCIPGTLTVTKAPLTVKVNDETKVYGAQNPSFSLSFDGLKNDETVPAWASRPTIQTEATRYSDVGQYDIKVSGGVAVNYETQMMDGILDIKPAALTIRANDASRLYYDEEPAFSYTCNGFVNGDGEDALSARPILSTNATKKSDTGEYDITPSGADSHNYAISYVKGTLRVRPRTLTASVGDYERKYNEENPAFAVTYDGFVGNEDERVLTTKPTARTAATKTSDVGTYRIDVAGGEAKNYGFSYVPGRLTINKAEQSIAWNQDFRGLRVGDQVELKATASSGLQVTYSMESYEPAEIYTAGTTYWLDCKAEGETQIVAVQEGNRNYYATNRIRKPLIVGPVAIVEAEDGSLVKIQSTQLGIRVTGAKQGENIRIYTLDGMLQRSVRVEEPTTYIQMKRNNIYIVRVGEKVVKLKH